MSDAELNITDLHCFRCGREIHSDSPRGWGGHLEAPNDALIFHANGNYGSTIYDQSLATSGREYLLVVICDPCVRGESEKGNVLRALRRVAPPPMLERWQPWNPEPQGCPSDVCPHLTEHVGCDGSMQGRSADDGDR